MEKLMFKTKLHIGQVTLGLVNKLQQILNDASQLANNPNLSLDQQGQWSRVATFTAQVIQNLSKGFNENEVYAHLAKLETLIKQAKAAQQKAETSAQAQS